MTENEGTKVVNEMRNGSTTKVSTSREANEFLFLPAIVCTHVESADLLRHSGTSSLWPTSSTTS